MTLLDLQTMETAKEEHNGGYPTGSSHASLLLCGHSSMSIAVC